MRRLLPALTLLATPALARDALGMFGAWGAFRDAQIPRCYAIAMPTPGGKKHETQPYADVSIWPKKAIRGAVHIHLSHPAAPGNAPILTLAGQHFRLTASGAEAWSTDPRMDAAITAQMRVAPSMTITARDPANKPFVDTYPLSGAPTAMDAAALACANR